MTRTRARPAAEADLPRREAQERLRAMTLIRRFEERCVELYSATRIRGFMHLAIGQEAIAVGVMRALGAEDNVVATYREHAHALARGVAPEAVMAEMFGVVEGTSRGRGGSMHLFDAATRFYGGNAIVAAGLPLASGLALADHMQHRPAVTACFFGEGAVAEGEFHETMNLTALWNLPVLFCCENNQYAMGTALSRSEAVVDLALRAAGYGMPAWAVDGMDVAAVEAAARRAATMIRGGGGPVFLELTTYRFRAHSMYDPERYRTKEEVAAWRERDPLVTFPAAMAAAGLLTEDDLDAIATDADARIEAAVAAAEAGTPEPLADLTRFVYWEEGPPP